MDTARTSELSAVSAGGKTSRKSMQTFAAVGGVLHYVRGETLEVEVWVGLCAGEQNSGLPMTCYFSFPRSLFCS